MIRFFRYQGSKEHVVDTINRLVISNNKHNTYIEPFLGSGTIFNNIPDIFDVYRLNDLDENILDMWSSLKYYDYGDYVVAYNIILEKFGDIKESKEAYYKFRDWYNETYHFNQEKKLEKGLYLYFLANSCINSMLRFGPNGMNQSFGNRLYFFTKENCDIIKNKLEKSVLTNTDYGRILRGVNNSLIYVDPPYYKRHTSYLENFSKDDLVELIDLLRMSDGPNTIFYSDIETEVSNLMMKSGFTKLYAKDMRNISPLRQSEFIDEREVLYHNIKSRFFQ